MDDIAQMSGLTPADRAERAQAAWDLYARAYGGSEIEDLVADLLHLADITTDKSGDHVLASAELHYGAELSDDTD